MGLVSSCLIRKLQQLKISKGFEAFSHRQLVFAPFPKTLAQLISKSKITLLLCFFSFIGLSLISGSETLELAASWRFEELLFFLFCLFGLPLLSIVEVVGGQGVLLSCCAIALGTYLLGHSLGFGTTLSIWILWKHFILITWFAGIGKVVGYSQFRWAGMTWLLVVFIFMVFLGSAGFALKAALAFLAGFYLIPNSFIFNCNPLRLILSLRAA